MKVVLIIILFQMTLLCFSRLQYSETKSNISKKLKFLKENSQLIKADKVTFGYTVNKGVYCKAAKNIEPNEVLFSIPSEFVIYGCILIIYLKIR